MATTKKPSPDLVSPYKEAAAARRVKVAATRTFNADEAKPIDGRIRVTLSGKAIPPSRQRQLFGPSRIEIPEFLPIRKKSD
jgi:hypothetical protein